MLNGQAAQKPDLFVHKEIRFTEAGISGDSFRIQVQKHALYRHPTLMSCTRSCTLAILIIILGSEIVLFLYSCHELCTKCDFLRRSQKNRSSGQWCASVLYLQPGATNFISRSYSDFMSLNENSVFTKTKDFRFLIADSVFHLKLFSSHPAVQQM